MLRVVRRPSAHTVHLGAATLLRISAEGLGTALVLVVQARTGQAATAGFLQAAIMLPYVLAGPITGHTLDRTTRPRAFALTMTACYLLAAAFLLLTAGRVPLLLALAFAVAIGCTEPVVVAFTGLLPRFVPAHRLTWAYGLEAATYNIAAIAGPGLAAGLTAALGAGYAGAAVVGCATLGMTLLPLLSVPPPGHRPAPARRPEETGERPAAELAPAVGPDTAGTRSQDAGRRAAGEHSEQPAAAIGRGGATARPEPAEAREEGCPAGSAGPGGAACHAVTAEAQDSGGPSAGNAGPGKAETPRDERVGAALSKEPAPEMKKDVPALKGRAPALDVIAGGIVVLLGNPVLRAVTVATTLAFLGMGAVAVTAVLFAEHIGRSAGVGGQLIAAFAAGSLIGSLGSARWLSARRAEWVLMAGMAAFGTALAVTVWAPSLPWALAGFLLAGICDGPVFAATLTVRQREAPADRLGQVNTTGGSLKIGSAAVGAALAGALAGSLGGPGLLLGMAAFQFTGAACGVLLLLLARRRGE